MARLFPPILHMKQRITDEQLRKFFQENNLKGSVHYYTALGRKIRYISVGEKNLPTLFFIPGSPASVSLYKDYYKDPALSKRFRMLAVDRPGYGKSGYGEPEPSIQRQSEMIRPMIEGLQEANKPVIICAGSYGASIACRLVMDHPNIAHGMVLDAPSLAPGQEKVFWLAPVAERSFIKWLLLPHQRVANTEKVHHTEELAKMLPLWKNIRIPVIYIQGEKDGMIYKSNADFAKQQLVNCPHLQINFIPGQEHFITIKQMPFIRNKILDMANIVERELLMADYK
jgi:pimeloyl-ACP methyl ester carboxylesterase